MRRKGNQEREKNQMGGEMGRQTVIRNEYEADAKPTGDSPGVCCGGFLMN